VSELTHLERLEIERAAFSRFLAGLETGEFQFMGMSGAEMRDLVRFRRELEMRCGGRNVIERTVETLKAEARVRELEEGLREALEYAEHESWRCQWPPRYYLTSPPKDGHCPCGLSEFEAHARQLLGEQGTNA
jgi:hypothetical protein